MNRKVNIVLLVLSVLFILTYGVMYLFYPVAEVNIKSFVAPVLLLILSIYNLKARN